MVLVTNEGCVVEFKGSGESIVSLLLDSDLESDECKNKTNICDQPATPELEADREFFGHFESCFCCCGERNGSGTLLRRKLLDVERCSCTNFGNGNEAEVC
ncbi:hypothetical protein X798_02930, partial [Onchocerca flexuosa]